MSGTYSLHHCRAEKIEIVCENCRRHGSYSVAKLTARFGSDMVLPEVRKRILLEAGCPQVEDTSNICRAKFTRDSVLSWTKEDDMLVVAHLLK